MCNLNNFACLFSITLAAFTFIGCASTTKTSTSRTVPDDWWYAAQTSIREVQGQAEVSVDGATWTKAAKDQQVEVGYRIRTGPNSHVLLDFGEETGGIARLMPDSMLIIEQLGPATKNSEVITILNLPQGRIIGDTLKLPKDKKILVKTPNGTQELQ